MAIADFIREEVLRPRLAAAGCLVVYDAQGRYKDLCLDLKDGKTQEDLYIEPPAKPKTARGRKKKGG